jgi:hypothetical protein
LKSQISISRPIFPIVREKRQRAFDLVRNNINIEQEIAIKSTEFRYMLKADISRFYDTMYTHSIPWALHGKDIAKSERRINILYGNALDKWTRGTRDGQTLGISIGPDSSVILSEIITAAIDIEFQKQLEERINGIRIIDDYFLFFQDLHEAENALVKLHKILKSFELEMNPIKTKISEVPHILEPIWKPAIRQFFFRIPENPSNNVTTQRTDIINYFSRVNEFCTLFPEDNILKYGIKRIRSKDIFYEDLPLYESLLLKSTLIQSSCIPNVVDILTNHKDELYEGKFERICNTVSELIRYHSKYSNDFEIAWALWLAKDLNIEIEKNECEILSKIDNPIVVLLALEMKELGLINSDINEDLWKKYLVKEQLYDDHWLLAYESVMQGWLIAPEDYLENDPFFKILKDNEVSFYDSTLTEISSIPDSFASGS